MIWHSKSDTPFTAPRPLRFQRGQDEVKVLVRYPDSERKSLGDVEKMRIRTPDGSAVPFSRVAEVNMDQGYASIQRAQRLTGHQGFGRCGRRHGQRQ